MSAVDQRVGTGASRVRRLLSRALLVVGGSLAGTAAVWALSTAPASAEVPVDHEVVTEIAPGGPHGSLPRDPFPQDASHGPVEAALTQVGTTPIPNAPARTTPVGSTPVGSTPVGQALRKLDTTLRTPRVHESRPPRLGKVAEDIRGAVGHMGSWFQPRLPELAPVDVVGRTAAQRATETTPVATAVPVSAGTPVVQGVFGKLSLAWLETLPQPTTVLPGDTGSSLPGDPSGLPSMPFAPLGAPAHCSCGGDGSGSFGGGSGPFTVASTDRIDSAVARALFPATERNVVMPGKQPGITPD